MNAERVRSLVGRRKRPARGEATTIYKRTLQDATRRPAEREMSALKPNFKYHLIRARIELPSELKSGGGPLRRGRPRRPERK